MQILSEIYNLLLARDGLNTLNLRYRSRVKLYILGFGGEKISQNEKKGENESGKRFGNVREPKHKSDMINEIVLRVRHREWHSLRSSFGLWLFSTSQITK